MAVRFGPALRLHARRDFTAIQQHGRRVGARYFTIVGRPNALGHDRLGLVASRRLGGAVVRNRTKRRLREVFRRQLAAPAQHGCRGWDLVVIGRPGIAAAPFAALTSEFGQAVRRLRSGPQQSV
jgi:ribonuclease P protein component